MDKYVKDQALHGKHAAQSRAISVRRGHGHNTVTTRSQAVHGGARCGVHDYLASLLAWRAVHPLSPSISPENMLPARSSPCSAVKPDSASSPPVIWSGLYWGYTDI